MSPSWTYRTVWMCTTGVLVTSGVGTVVLLVTLAEPLLSAAVLTLSLLARHLSHVWQAASRSEPAGPTCGPGPVIPVEVRISAGLVLTFSTVAGLAIALGVPGVTLVLVDLVAGIPLLVERGRSGAQKGAATLGAAPGPPASTHDRRLVGANDRSLHAGDADGRGECARLASSLAELGVVELCRAWQASSQALSVTLDPAEQVHIVGARMLLLDAMSLCDRDGVSAWLACKYPDRRGPASFLLGGPHDGS
jgi:hypothetical protein